MAVFDFFYENFYQMIVSRDLGSKFSGNVPRYLSFLSEQKFFDNFHLSQKCDKKYTMCPFYQITESTHDFDSVWSVFYTKYTIRINVVCLGL